MSTSLITAAVTGVLVAGNVLGQAYPNKPIRILTGAQGGGADFSARLIANGIAGSLGQSVIVDNRPTGFVPAEIVSKAPPDGYTLYLSGSNFWIGSLLQKVPYDAEKDFMPITLTDMSPNILVVHPSVVASSVQELIAAAKVRPGTLNYASGSVGGPTHLSAELFKSMAGVNIIHVPYKGSGPAAIALIGGEVQLFFAPAAAVTVHVKAGKLRALAVTSAVPSALAPGLPTVAASLPGYEMVGATGVFAPAKTSTAIINKLNQDIVRFIKTSEAREKLLSTAAESVGSSPDELASAMKADRTRLGKVIRDAGIRLE